MNKYGLIFLDHSAPKGQQVIKWNPKQTPEPAGVHDLVNFVIEFREFVRDKRLEVKRSVTTLAAMSDRSVSDLIRMAYQASFRTDEGRPIRTRLAACGEDIWHVEDEIGKPSDPTPLPTEWMRFCRTLWHQTRTVEENRLHAYRFRELVPLTDHKPIVKFSPLTPEHDGVISVSEISGKLFVSGLGLLDRDNHDGALLHMPGMWAPSAGLLIQIIGPGHLRVAEGNASFELFADRLVAHQSLWALRLVHTWLAEQSCRLMNTLLCCSDYSPDALFLTTVRETNEINEEEYELDVYMAVARILRTAILLGHGGAFAVLPGTETERLHIRYPLDVVDLGGELIETWLAHCRLWNTARGENTDQLGAAESKRMTANAWLSRLSSIGQLSAADGCVVFDRRLVLHGFGGSIKTDLAEHDWGVCHDLATEEDVPAVELLRSYGERHKSAFALCRKVPNAIVFVISQDGNLRVFASDQAGKVHFASDLRI